MYLSFLPFFTGTKGHTGYHACSYCKQRGTRIGRRTAFDTSIGQERTDDEFRNPGHGEHNIYSTPLLNCPFVDNLVWKFPLDCMHLVDLGVMGKLLKIWMSDHDFSKELANQFLENVYPYIPSDFTRKPRSLDEYDNFKATELRQFVLYIGIPMLKKCCSNTDKIRNFIQLSIGYRLLMGRNGIVTNDDCAYAKTLLEDFVEGFANLYGAEHVSFNIHGLLHLHQMVTLYGPLSTYTAYDFENFYQLVRKWVRKGGHYFEQIFRRWKQTGGKVVRRQTKSKKKIGAHIIAVNKKDSCFMLKDGTIWVITEKKVNVDGVIYLGKKFRNKNTLFDDPTSSSIYNIFTVSNLSFETHQINSDDIVAKFVRVPFSPFNSFHVIPLVHV